MNRANRVRQLSNDITWLQTTLKENVDDVRAGDGAAVVVLNTLAHDAGYKALDEYVDAAAAQLTAEDRAGLDKIFGSIGVMAHPVLMIGEAFQGGQARADLQE